MFGLYFSRYLSDKNVLDAKDAGEVADLGYPGYIDGLVEKNLLKRDEAEKHLRGFMEENGFSEGDVAILGGGRFEDIVPLFISFDANEAVAGNIEAFKKDSGLTDAQMEELKKDGEMDWVLPGYVRKDPPLYARFVNVAIENFSRLISDRLVLKKSHVVKKRDFEHLSCQSLKGEHHIFFGIAGDENGLRAVAGAFVRREFTEMEKKVYDCVCELINSILGLFASELSVEGIRLEIDLPYNYTGKSIASNGELYCLPVALEGAEIEFLLSFDCDMEIM